MRSIFTYASIFSLVACSHSPVVNESVSRDVASVEEVKILLSPNGIKEECHIPQAMPEFPFSKKDNEDFAELCAMDFYGTTNPATTYAICPKLNSTNPATNVYKIEGADKLKLEDKLKVKAQMEKNFCKDGNLDAKFKQSITCSYYPSMIGYFYLSKILDTVDVPTAVYRTMDLKEHKKVSAQGVKAKKDTYELWVQFASWESATEPHPKKDLLFSSDRKQIVGALNANPGGEEKYSEIMGLTNGAGAKCGYSDRAKCFTTSSSGGFPVLASSKRITQKNYPKSFAEAAQLMQKLKDVSTMVVMDHIMSQQDRYGNQHYELNYFYEDEAGKFDKVEVKKVVHDKVKKTLTNKKDPSKVISYKNVAEVKVLLMKDNDCGVIKTNKAKELKMVSQIKHLDYKLYKNLLKFSKFIMSDEGGAYFKKFAKFTSSDLSTIRKNTEEVVSAFKSKCETGDLAFDLGFNYYLKGTDYNHNDFACDLE